MGRRRLIVCTAFDRRQAHVANYEVQKYTDELDFLHPIYSREYN